MDLKKLFIIITVAGCIILIFGVFKYQTNQPKKFNQSESGQSVFGGRDDLGNWMNVQAENFDRQKNRENANTIMMIGGIIALIVGILRFSFKSEKPHTTSLKESIPKTDFYYCSNCGNKLVNGENCTTCK